MVKVCSITAYPKENETKNTDFFNKFSYPLHMFQKWAIEAIVTGNHALVCAPTGSGKSLPAEFALDYMHSIGKRTIYCSPIKSLSNQKFYDFQQKYPHITIGLITGDIKTNPDADVLIMTTEILLNKLYQIKSKSPAPASTISFDMNLETELGCVIFDEIHMINDTSRGHVWEQSIMMLPKHVQIVGLSATLHEPESFALWLEMRGEQSNTSGKIVYLTSKKDRIVPLTHYTFITTTQGIFKSIKDKAVHEEIKSMINKPFVIQDAKGKFFEEDYFKMAKMLKLFESKDIRVKRQHALNQVSKYLTENEMTPAICYVFSRKQLELCAKEITTNLLEFDSKVPYTIDRECEQIIRKLPNYQEYLQLPEYINMVGLLRKGVAMHHAGLLPVLREIVEILFAKGYIKMLFATETVSIGLNLPVKTTIFTDVNKFDGTASRILYGHEYTQAAGRAGRLGLDPVGHVIHLNNLFRNVDSTNYRTMLAGKPQVLSSKFKISFNLLLNLIDIGDNNFLEFARRSMIQEDIDGQLKTIYYRISELQKEMDNLQNSMSRLRTPMNVMKEYFDLQNNIQMMSNKKRKEAEREIKNIQDNYKNIDSDKMQAKKYNDKQSEVKKLEQEYAYIEKHIDNNVFIIIDMLEKDGFIMRNQEKKEEEEQEVPSIQLTLKGSIATHLREVHCLVFANLLETNMLDSLSSKQLVAIFSCFTNINVNDDFKDFAPHSIDSNVQNMILRIAEMYNTYLDKETEYQVNTGTEYNFHYDLLNYSVKWCDCESVDECKYFLHEMEKEKEIFLGEFVKALLKINNIASEMEKIAEMIGNIQFLSKLREIPTMTLKYVVTTQSLYV